MRCCLFTALFSLALLGPLQTGRSTPRPRREVIYVQPLGSGLPQKALDAVQQALAAFTGLAVKRLPTVALPRWTYYKKRRRYRAERLLTVLKHKLPTDGLRILGLTAVDISTTKGKYPDWGVLGLATLDGRACVISAYRCKRRAKSRLHAHQRLAKVAVHEIGHTLGLDHCPQKGCLMRDARGKVATSDHEYDLCDRCRRRLKANGYRLPEKPKIPWPRP